LLLQSYVFCLQFEPLANVVVIVVVEADAKIILLLNAIVDAVDASGICNGALSYLSIFCLILSYKEEKKTTIKNKLKITINNS
jgi:hypothetical protein